MGSGINWLWRGETPSAGLFKSKEPALGRLFSRLAPLLQGAYSPEAALGAGAGVW